MKKLTTLLLSGLFALGSVGTALGARNSPKEFDSPQEHSFELKNDCNPNVVSKGYGILYGTKYSIEGWDADCDGAWDAVFFYDTIIVEGKKHRGKKPVFYFFDKNKNYKPDQGELYYGRQRDGFNGNEELSY